MMMPKSMAPMESRLAASPVAWRKMKAKSSASGMVSAVMTAARMLTRKKMQNEKNQKHAAEEIAFDGVGGDADEVAAVVVGMNLYVGRKNAAVELLGFLLDAAEDVLGLLAAAHQDDAFDGVVVVFVFFLEAEDAEARRVAHDYLADVFHADRDAVVAADDDFADVVGGFEQAETAHVVELAALGVKAAAGVGVVGLQSVEDLRDREMEVVELRGIELDVVLHRRAAETGIVGDAGNAAVGALDDPVFEGVEFRGRAIGAFDDVAIDEAAGAEERGHAGRHAAGKLRVGDALEDDLAGEVWVGAFVEGEDDVGETVERDRAHDAKIRRAVHGQFERKSGEALDFFGGVAGPLRDSSTIGGERSGYASTGMRWKENAPATMMNTVNISTTKRCWRANWTMR